MSPMIPRRNKVAFVTGASRGIGRAIALELAKSGHDLVLAARTVTAGEKHTHGIAINAKPETLPGSLEETAALARDFGVYVVMVRLDLKDMESGLNAVDLAMRELGKIDVFVNNAIYKGRGDLQRVLDLHVGDYAEMIQCNVMTPFAMIQKMLIEMLKRNSGIIVHMSTPSVRLEPKFPVGSGGWDFGYASSKAAMEKLIPLLAVEHPVESGLRFYNLEPGLVVTEIMKQKGVASTFAKGFGDVPPEVAAKVVAWLCSLPTQDSMGKKFNGRVIYAPRLCEELGLIEGYREQKPKQNESKL